LTNKKVLHFSPGCAIIIPEGTRKEIKKMFDINVMADYYAELEAAWAEEPAEEWPDNLWDD
jgi:hypothetical protein